jgi:SpoVK/Ycf46/Vps4 family AAA+-type ATPase
MPEELKQATAAGLDELVKADPALMEQVATYQALSDERALVAATLKATQDELAAWRKANGGLTSMGRIVQGLHQADEQLRRGNLKFWEGVADTVTEPEKNGPAPQRARIQALQKQLQALDVALKGISEGKPLEESVLKETRNLQVDEMLRAKKQGKPLSAQQVLSGRLEFLKRDVAEKNGPSGAQNYQATVLPYLVQANKAGESIQGLPGGKPSVAGVLNQLIAGGAIANDGKLVTSAASLAQVRESLGAVFANAFGTVGKSGAATLKLFAQLLELTGIGPNATFAEKSIAITGMLQKEESRLTALDSKEPLAGLKGTVVEAQKQMEALNKVAGPGFLKSALNILDAPSTWGMLAVGALTDGLGAAALGRSAVGVGELAQLASAGTLSARAVGMFALGTVVDGAAFHTGMNLFNIARGKSEEATWGAGDYAATVLMFQTLGAVKANALVRDATGMGKVAATALNGTSAQVAAKVGGAVAATRLLAEETAALSLLAGGEAAMRGGDIPKAAELLKENFTFLVTMRMLHLAKGLIPGTADAKMKATAKLEDTVRTAQRAFEAEPTDANLKAFYAKLREYASQVGELNVAAKKAGLTEKTQQLIKNQVDVVSAGQFNAIVEASFEHRLKDAKSPAEKKQLTKKYDALKAHFEIGGAFYDPVTGRVVINSEVKGDIDAALRHEFTHVVFHSLSAEQRATLMKELGSKDVAQLDEALAHWNTVASGPLQGELQTMGEALAKVDAKSGISLAQKYGLDLRSLGRADLEAKFVGTPLSPQSQAKDLVAMESSAAPVFESAAQIRALTRGLQRVAVPQLPVWHEGAIAELKRHFEPIDFEGRPASQRTLRRSGSLDEWILTAPGSYKDPTSNRIYQLSDSSSPWVVLGLDTLATKLHQYLAPLPPEFLELPPAQQNIARELLGLPPGPRSIEDLPLIDRTIEVDGHFFQVRKEGVYASTEASYPGDSWEVVDLPAGPVRDQLDALAGRLRTLIVEADTDPRNDAAIAIALARALGRPETTVFRGQALSKWNAQIQKDNAALGIAVDVKALAALGNAVDAVRDEARHTALLQAVAQWQVDPSKDFTALLEEDLTAALAEKKGSLERDFGKLGNAAQILKADLADPESHRAWMEEQAPDFAYGEVIVDPKVERVVTTPPSKVETIKKLVRLGDVGGEADKSLLEQALSAVDEGILKTLEQAGYTVTIARNNVTHGAKELRSMAMSGTTTDHADGLHLRNQPQRILIRSTMEDGKLTLNVGVLMHEIGHAIDSTLRAVPLGNNRDFIDAFETEHQRLPPYFHNQSEFMAEVFSRYALDPERAHREFPKASAAFDDELNLGASLVDGASLVKLNESMTAQAPVTARPDPTELLRQFERVNRLRATPSVQDRMRLPREPYILELDGEPPATLALARQLGRQLLTMRAPTVSPFGVNDGLVHVDAATFNDPARLSKLLDDVSAGAGSLLYLDDLSGIDAKSVGFTVLKDFTQRNGDRVPVVLAGSKEERKAFSKVLPGVLRKTIEIDPMTPAQVAELVRREVSNEGYRLSVEAQKLLDQRSRTGGYSAAMELWSEIKSAQFDRARALPKSVEGNPAAVAYVLSRDIAAVKAPARSDPIGNIQKMIGLSAVKEKIKGIMAAAALAKQREKQGIEGVELPRFNLLFAGNPGTGKTTVAKEFARAAFEQGYVKKNHVAFVKIQDLLAGGSPEENVRKLFEANKDGVIFIDEIHQLQDTEAGKRAFKAMIPYLGDAEFKRTAFIGAGYSDELGELIRDVDAGAQRRLISVPFEDYTKAELALIQDKMLADAKLEASPEVKAALLERVVRKQRAMKHPGNAGDVEVTLGLAQEKQAARLAEVAKTKELTSEDFKTLTLDDVVVPNPLSVESVWAEIEALKGQEKVKSQLRDMQYLIALNKELGDDPLTGVEPYIILDGPAGAGKSTLAGLIGKLMAANDIIPDGEVVKMVGGDLVGGFVGNSTTLAVRKAFEKAWGKTLFIDEIGALAKAVGGYEEQGAKEMLTQMENNRGKLIVVIADYAHNVDQFLGLDAGLPRRFGTRLSLESMEGFAAAEALETQLTQLKLKLNPGVNEHLKKRLDELAALPSWASGGEVRTLANKVKKQQAAELMTQRKAGKSFDVGFVDLTVLDRALDELEADIKKRPSPNQGRAGDPRFALDRERETKSETKDTVEATEVSAQEEESVAQVDQQFGARFNDDPAELERQTGDPNSDYNQALGRLLGISSEAAMKLRVRIANKAQRFLETTDSATVERFNYHCPFCGRVDGPACKYMSYPLAWKIEKSLRKPWRETIVKGKPSGGGVVDWK